MMDNRMNLLAATAMLNMSMLSGPTRYRAPHKTPEQFAAAAEKKKKRKVAKASRKRNRR